MDFTGNKRGVVGRIAAMLLAFGALSACDDRESVPSTPGAPTVPDNRPDTPRSGSLQLDEASVQGAFEGGKLRLSWRVRGVGAAAASGQLEVSLRTVDGKTATSSAQVAYGVASGAEQTLTAELDLPADLARSSDWVKHVVRLSESKEQGVRVTRSLLGLLTPYDVQIEGPSTVRRGKPASYRVRAQQTRGQQPLAGVPVGLTVRRDGVEVEQLTGVTGTSGDAVFELNLDEVGSYEVHVAAASQGTSTELASGVSVKQPGGKVLLTSDKPIYQPGQTMHLRALALGEGDNRPLGSQPATIEVSDGKGNKIARRAVTTDAHGIAATDFAIGSVVNMGTFKVRAQVGELAGEKSVSVSRYALPKFRVGAQTDRSWYRAGNQVTVALDAGYFFGKPVAGGDVTVEAATLDVGESVFQTVQTKTDAQGKASVTVTLPSTLAGLPLDGGNGLVALRIKVADTAQQEVSVERLVTVAQSGVQQALVPDATSLVPGVDNQLDLFASDPLGAPLPGAAVSLLLPDGTSQSGLTDDQGHAAFGWTPPAGATSATFTSTVQAPGSAPDTRAFTFDTQPGQAHVVVRTDKAVYGLGEAVQVTVRTSEPAANVYVDWLNGGQTIDMRTVQAVDGQATFSMPVDVALAGSNRIEAYVVDADGNVARAGRTVFARSHGALRVELATDKPQYAPGEPAQLTFSVVDDQGKPAVAALGVQVVDEAVFSLVDARPGLLRTYFELEQQYAEPKYEIKAPSANLDELLFESTASADAAKAAAAQTRTAAAFAALGSQGITGLQLSSRGQTETDVRGKLQPYLNAAHDEYKPALVKVVKDVVADLKKKGCTPEQYYCSGLGTSFGELLGKQLAKQVVLYDFWGNAYKVVGYYDTGLVSRGPDEIEGTADDVAITFTMSELGIPYQGYPTAGGDGQAGAGGSGPGDWNGGGQAGSISTGGPDPAEGGAEPRVRKDFPETLYVNPSLLTGPDGKATVTVPMADSITSWRVSSLANAASGKLGGGVGAVTVFQDFFADINFPATLTRGDEVTFPVAVYNYLPTPQTVQVQLEPGPWYSALGATTVDVALGAGEVKGVQVPVRVEQVGVHTLTVKAKGSAKADAVARVVRVVPDGKEIAASTSGSLAAGSTTHPVSFPGNAVVGSPHLHLDVYPAFLSQVVGGMDSMLQAPYGCFEQTTSTTWPNVLVTRYMTQTGQITPAIQLKAESLISAGYQRLLTFEHPGGGFSWFGTQDPKPFLSVTAFGIMEFADMALVAPVDPAMVQRTTSWMLAQQKGDGSWEGDQTEFFSFQTSTVRNTAFVAWALASAGVTGGQVDQALGYVKGHLTAEESDVYTLGIVANAFASAAPGDPFGAQLLDDLEAKKATDGDMISWSAAGTQTDFYGQGQDADVTSTALVAHAMLTAGGHGATVGGALNYLTGQRDPQGNFGSTQATIWTLRTLILAATKGTESAVGTLEVTLDGKPFSTLELAADQGDIMRTVDLSSAAGAVGASHDVGLTFVGTGKVSYNLVSRHHLPWSDVAQEPSGPVAITLGYDRTSLTVNETVTASVTVTNTTAATQKMVMVTLGIPPGFEVLGEDFAPYLADQSLSRFETTGKQLDLYISTLAPAQPLTLSYRLRASLPIKAEDGGAKAYPYYQPSETSSAASTTFEVSGL